MSTQPTPEDPSKPTPQFGDAACGTGPKKTETAFVAGAAVGLRTFRVGVDGWLRGVSYRQVWKHGENVATCYAGRSNKLPRGVPQGMPSAYTSLGAYGFPVDPEGEPFLMRGFDANPCKGVDPECACGFYAYHDPGQHRYGTGPEPQITGIVEGYGKVVLGPLGYRAEKARLVAVVIDTKMTAQQQQHIDDLREAIAAAGQLLKTLTIGSVRLGRNPRRMVYLGIVLTGAVAVAPALAPLAMAVIGAITSLAVGSEVADRKLLAVTRAEVRKAALAFRLEVDEVLGTMERRKNIPARVAANYPGIRIYDSTEAMLAAHPVESLAHLVDNDAAGDDLC